MPDRRPNRGHERRSALARVELVNASLAMTMLVNAANDFQIKHRSTSLATRNFENRKLDSRSEYRDSRQPNQPL
jgi:hypothetical protein